MTWMESLLETSVGPARIKRARPRARLTLVLGHGAGGGTQAADLQYLAGHLVDDGLGVVLVDQPWRVAGRKVAPAPAALDRAWLEIVPQLGIRRGLFVAGRSAGARVACRTAQALGASGAVCLAFPLHPPGRPDRSRADELRAAGVPVLVVQGERDPFGHAAELVGLEKIRVVDVPGADHALRPADATWAADVAEFMRGNA